MADALTLQQVTLELPESDGRRVLAEGIDLAVPAGTVIGLHGPSGAGKSTLLRACIRLHPVTTGEIRLQDQLVTQIPPPELRRRLAYLRQFPVFSPGLVADALREAFQYCNNDRPVPTDEDLRTQFDHLDADPALLERDTGRLSGGEAQAVAFIRAVLLEPEVMLLDEPTASLDPDHEESFVRRVLRWVGEDGRSVLWVTHDRSLLRRLDTTIWTLTRHGLVDDDGGRR